MNQDLNVKKGSVVYISEVARIGLTGVSCLRPELLLDDQK